MSKFNMYLEQNKNKFVVTNYGVKIKLSLSVLQGQVADAVLGFNFVRISC